MSLKIRLECTHLKTALDLHNRITQAEIGLLTYEEDNLILRSKSKEVFLELKIPSSYLNGSETNDINFGINIKDWLKLCKGRKTIELCISNEELSFESNHKKNSFTGRIKNISTPKIKPKKQTDIESIHIKKEEFKHIENQVRYISLKNLIEPEHRTIFIKIESTGLKTLSYDRWRISSASSINVDSESKKEFNLTLPIFEVVVKLAEENDIEISLGKAFTYVKGHNFILSVPTVYAIKNQSYDKANNYLNLLANNDISKNQLVGEFTLPTAYFKQIIDNIEPLNHNNSFSIELISDTEVKFFSKNENGLAEELITTTIQLDETKENRIFSFNTELLLDQISGYKFEDIEIRLHEKFCVLTGTKNNETIRLGMQLYGTD